MSLVVGSEHVVLHVGEGAVVVAIVETRGESDGLVAWGVPSL